MNIHKFTVYVIDFDEIGAEEAKDIFENARYPNHCMSPKVHEIKTVDIGEWYDDNPLNRKETFDAEIKRLFA